MNPMKQDDDLITGCNPRESSMSQEDLTLLGGLFRNFVRQLRSQLEIDSPAAFAENGLTYTTTIPFFKVDNRTVPGRGLLNKMAKAFCRETDGTFRPWLAYELYARAGRLRISQSLVELFNTCRGGDTIYCNLPYVPLQDEELVQAVLGAAVRGVKLIFLNTIEKEDFDGDQRILQEAASSSSDKGSIEAIRQNIHWVVRCEAPATGLFAFVIFCCDKEWYGLYPLLAERKLGSSLLLPYSFMPIDRWSLDALRMALQPVRDLVNGSDVIGAGRKGFQKTEWR